MIKHSILLVTALSFVLRAGLLAAETSAAGSVAVPNERTVGKIRFEDPDEFFRDDGSPDYVAYYLRRYRYMADHFFRPEDEEKIRETKEIGLGDPVAAMVWLSRHENRDLYLDRAHDAFGILLEYADGNAAVTTDCFGFPSLLQAAVMLKEAGRLDADWEPKLKRITLNGVAFSDKHFPSGGGNQGVDGNQGLARMYGQLLAKKLYPDDQDVAKAAARVNGAFDKILAEGDIHSDSRNYFEVSYPYFVLIAHELGRERDVAGSADLDRMFANIRDAVSPNGLLPEFGSGYFSPNRYPNTPLILEYAGFIYHDPSYSAAARRYFGMLVQSGPNDPPHLHAAVHNSAFMLAQIIDLIEPPQGKVGDASFVSGVTRRNAISGRDVPGFVILRPSVKPGAPMVMMDVLGEGDHCQPEFKGSIAYYEAGQVPLFYQYGRYINGASRGNQIYFGEPDAVEPDPKWLAGTWHTMVIPVDRLITEDGMAKIDQVQIRTASRSKGSDRGLVFDNFRLAGSGGVEPIINMATADWRGNTTTSVEGRSGEMTAVSIIDDGNGVYVRDFKPLAFDPKKYQEVLCDVKWFGPALPGAQMRLQQDDRGWVSVDQTALVATLDDVKTERHGEDSWARLTYSSYGTFDSTLLRQIVLTKEGVLAIRDDILPGKSAHDRPAYSLWQMYSIDDQKGDRFTSFGECVWPSSDRHDSGLYRRGMSVYFSGPKGLAAGKQVIPSGRLSIYRDIQRDLDLRTTYARLPMQAGKPVYFNLLVVPHAPDTDLNALDSKTSAEHDDKHSKFRTLIEGTELNIKIGKDGNWSVAR